MTAHQQREALQRMDAGESMVDLARTFGVDRATLYRMQAVGCTPEADGRGSALSATSKAADRAAKLE
jgi:hypothetical protein